MLIKCLMAGCRIIKLCRGCSKTHAPCKQETSTFKREHLQVQSWTGEGGLLGLRLEIELHTYNPTYVPSLPTIWLAYITLGRSIFPSGAIQDRSVVPRLQILHEEQTVPNHATKPAGELCSNASTANLRHLQGPFRVEVLKDVEIRHPELQMSIIPQQATQNQLGWGCPNNFHDQYGQTHGPCWYPFLLLCIRTPLHTWLHRQCLQIAPPTGSPEMGSSIDFLTCNVMRLHQILASSFSMFWKGQHCPCKNESQEAGARLSAGKSIHKARRMTNTNSYKLVLRGAA